jgi:histidinol phosphatase-like enzyme (inositol monophosphatase family)
VTAAAGRAAEPSIDALVALANRLADTAGAVVRPYFRSGLEVVGKADASPVTVADREAEAAMRALIERECPGHGILGEEHGAVRLDAEYVWVLDPIDGTKSFISGFPLFGTLIALLRGGRPVLGIIDQPVTRERWVGAEGRPTTFQGKPARTRRCAGLAQATLYSTAPDMFRDADAAAYERLRGAVKLARFGGDCYAYGQLASGHVDLVVEARLQPYDYLAQVPIIAGAGGTVTDWRGRPLGLHSDGRVAAAGDPGLHKDVLRLLAG